MRYLEYGNKNADVILLLHGGGLSWWNYREVATLLEHKYHVVLPILDGHGGSDRDFTSMEDCAEEVIGLIDSRFGGSVKLIGGVSLGAQVVLEVLSQRGGICDCALVESALVESALVVPSRLTHTLIRPAFGSCYGLIGQKWFAKLQFQSLRIRKDLFEDYFRDTKLISKENLISFMEANSLYELKDTLGACKARVSIFVGQRETGPIRRSARLIRERLPGSTLTVIPGLYHGEFSINRSKDYAQAVEALIAERDA